MLHAHRNERTHLHVLVTSRNGHRPILGKGEFVQQINQQRTGFVVWIEQRMILKTVREDKEQTRIQHGQINMLSGTASLSDIERTGHRLTRCICGDFVADQRPKKTGLVLTLGRGKSGLRLDNGVIGRSTT